MAKRTLVQNTSDFVSVDNRRSADLPGVTTKPVTEKEKRRAGEQASSWASLKDQYTNESSAPEILHDTLPDSNNSNRAEGFLTSGSSPHLRNREGQDAMGRVPVGPKPRNNLNDDSPAANFTQLVKTRVQRPFDLQRSSRFPSQASPERDHTPTTGSPDSGTNGHKKSNPKVTANVKEYQHVDGSMRPPKPMRPPTGSVNGSRNYYPSSTSNSSPHEDHNDPIVDEDDDIRSLSMAQKKAAVRKYGNVASKRSLRRPASPHLDTAKDPKNSLLDNNEMSRYFSANDPGPTSRPSSTSVTKQRQTNQANTHIKRVADADLVDADTSVDELNANPATQPEIWEPAKALADAEVLFAKSTATISRKKAANKAPVDLTSSADELGDEVSFIKPTVFEKKKSVKHAESSQANTNIPAKPKTGSSIEETRGSGRGKKLDSYPGLNEAFTQTIRWKVIGGTNHKVSMLQFIERKTTDLVLLDSKLTEVFTIAVTSILRFEANPESPRLILHTTQDLQQKGNDMIFLHFKDTRTCEAVAGWIEKLDKTVLRCPKPEAYLTKCFDKYRPLGANQTAQSSLENDTELDLLKAKSHRKLIELIDKNRDRNGVSREMRHNLARDSPAAEVSTQISGSKRRTRASAGNGDSDEPSTITAQSFYGSADEPEPPPRDRRSTRRQEIVKEPSPIPFPSWSQQNPDYADNWTNPLIYPPEPSAKNRQTVEKGDIPKLDDGEFLNDNLVNFGMRWLLEQADPTIKKRVYLANSFFYHKLSHDGLKASFSYANVERWTRQANIFDHDYIIIPVNENLHWYIAIICNPKKLLPGSDPLSKPSQEEAVNAATPEDPSSSTLAIDSPRNKNGTVDVKFQRLKIDGESDSSLAETKQAQRADDHSPSLVEVQVIIKSPPAKTLTTTPKPLKNAKKTSDPEQPLIITLDSLDGRHPTTITNLRKWLIEESRSKESKNIDPPPARSLGMKAEGIPAQSNWYDCGLYCLGYFRKFLENPNEFVRLLCRPTDSPDVSYINSFEMREELRNTILDLQKTAAKELDKEKLRKSALKRAKNRVTERPSGPVRPGPDNVASTSPLPRALGDEVSASTSTKSCESPRLLGDHNADNSSISKEERRSVETEKSTGIIDFIKNGVNVVKGGLGWTGSTAQAATHAAEIIEVVESSPELSRCHNQADRKSGRGHVEDESLVKIIESPEVPRTPSPEPSGSPPRAHAQMDEALESPGVLQDQTSGSEQGQNGEKANVILAPQFSFDFEQQSQDGQSSEPDLLNENARSSHMMRLEHLSPSSEADVASHRPLTPPRPRSSPRSTGQVIDLEESPTSDKKRKASQQPDKDGVIGSPQKRRRSPSGRGSPVNHVEHPHDMHRNPKRKNVDEDNVEVNHERQSKRRKSPADHNSAKPNDADNGAGHGKKGSGTDAHIIIEGSHTQNHSKGSSNRGVVRQQEQVRTRLSHIDDDVVMVSSEDDELPGEALAQKSTLRKSLRSPERPKRMKEKRHENGGLKEAAKATQGRLKPSVGQPSPVRYRTVSKSAHIAGRDSSDSAFIPRDNDEQEASKQRAANAKETKQASHTRFF